MYQENPLTQNPSQIVRDFGQLVCSIARRMISDPEKVKDAVQEVWLEILKSLPTFRGESQLSTWIYKIASRVTGKYARSERIYSARMCDFHFSQPEIPVEPEVEKRLWVKEQCDKCFTAFLHCLEVEARLIYIFREIIELPYSEIAEILEKDEAALRKNYSRARRKIQNYMNNNCPLSNPQGQCRCRIKRHLKEVELEREFIETARAFKRISLYKTAEFVLPIKNSWEKYL